MQGLLSNELISKNSLFGNISESNIKSIQRGSSILESNNNSKTINISNVNTEKSIVLINYTGQNVPTNAVIKLACKFIDNSSFNVSRGGVGDIVYFNWIVIEFNNVRSYQWGLTTSSNISISKINPNKSIAIVYTYSNSDTTADGCSMSYSYLLTETNLSVNQPKVAVTIVWQIIEFN